MEDLLGAIKCMRIAMKEKHAGEDLCEALLALKLVPGARPSWASVSAVRDLISLEDHNKIPGGAEEQLRDEGQEDNDTRDESSGYADDPLESPSRVRPRPLSQVADKFGELEAIVS